VTPGLGGLGVGAGGVPALPPTLRSSLQPGFAACGVLRAGGASPKPWGEEVQRDPARHPGAPLGAPCPPGTGARVSPPKAALGRWGPLASPHPSGCTLRASPGLQLAGFNWKKGEGADEMSGAPWTNRPEEESGAVTAAAWPSPLPLAARPAGPQPKATASARGAARAQSNADKGSGRAGHTRRRGRAGRDSAAPLGARAGLMLPLRQHLPGDHRPCQRGTPARPAQGASCREEVTAKMGAHQGQGRETFPPCLQGAPIPLPVSSPGWEHSVEESPARGIGKHRR